MDWSLIRTSFGNLIILENVIQLNETETRNAVHCNCSAYLWIYVFLQRLFPACYMLFFILPFKQKRDQFKSGMMGSKWIRVLKKLRNRISRTTLLWSSFCLIWLYVGLYFLLLLLKTSFSSFCAVGMNKCVVNLFACAAQG